jgi:hypothetical protein
MSVLDNQHYPKHHRHIGGVLCMINNFVLSGVGEVSNADDHHPTPHYLTDSAPNSRSRLMKAIYVPRDASVTRGL